MVAIYFDPVFLEHKTSWGHPERPDRLRAVVERLKGAELGGQLDWRPCPELAREQIQEVHTEQMVHRVLRTSESGGGWLDADTFVSVRSYEAAKRAAGATVDAVQAVVEGPERTAVCLVRPPGHHATQSRSMGFCLFNNVAIGARYATDRLGLHRVLILDWDVHHGNGTQDIFYDDARVMFVSLHRYPFYPGTGDDSETGRGPGLGYTLNVPIRYGTSRQEYREQFDRAVDESVRRLEPELVLVSAGYDAHRSDPIGSLGLEDEDFRYMADRLLEVANQYCDGRLVAVLEGGYDLDALSSGVLSLVEACLDCERRSKEH